MNTKSFSHRFRLRTFLLLPAALLLFGTVAWNWYLLAEGDDSAIQFAQKNHWQIKYDWEDEKRSTILQRLFPYKIDRRVIEIRYHFSDQEFNQNLGGVESLEKFSDFVSLRSFSYIGPNSFTTLFELPGPSLDFNKIRNISSLEHIEIEGWDTNNFKSMPPLLRLKTLVAPVSLDQAQLNLLGNCRNLETLEFGTDETDLSPLSKCTQLKTLKISPMHPVTDLNFTKTLQRLESLQIRNSVNNIDAIWETPKLKHLAISNSSFKTPSKFPPQLESIYLGNLNAANLDFLSDSKSLRNLVIVSSNIQDFSHLKEMESLKLLSLARTSFSDGTLLQDLDNLEALNLNFTKINSLDGVRKMKNLKYLSVQTNTLKKLGDLSGMSNLRQIETFRLNPTNCNLHRLPKIIDSTISYAALKETIRKNRLNDTTRWGSIFSDSNPFHWKFGIILYEGH